MNHDAWLEQADVYAVGALDGEERGRFEAHLAGGCAACAARLRETREALAALPRALPPAAPPPALRARLLERIAAERPGAPGRGATPAERPAGRALRWAGWAGVAVAAALLLLVSQQLGRAGRELAELRGRVATLEAELADRDATLRLLSDPAVRSVSLEGRGPSPGARAWLLWDPATREGLLLARGLPPVPAGRAYELWAIAGDQPVPAGVFTVDEAGRGRLRLPPLPAGLRVETFAVTVEPSGGVPRPTGAIHLAGKV
jgi:anti-sigma-K factor RskA